MKFKLQIVVLSLFCISNLFAIEVPRTWQTDADLHDVTFVDGDYGWAVGDHGSIWHTQNGGEIWREQVSGISTPLLSVHFIDREHGWAAGGKIVPLTRQSNGVLLRTTDGGATWNRTDKLLLPWIDRVHFWTHVRGIAIGQVSALYPSGAWFTDDAGKTWTPFSGAEGIRWRASDFKSSLGLLIGDRGELFRVTGNTSTPRLFRLGQRPDLATNGFAGRTAFAQVVDAKIHFAGTKTPILSADGGLTWEQIGRHEPGSAMDRTQLGSMAAVKDRSWLAGYPGNRILYSHNYASTWQAAVAPAMLPIKRLRFVDADNGWAVGAQGTILVTRDGGQSWKRQRGGDKRYALLGVFADERDIPWELLSQASGIDEFRTHIVLIGRSSNATDPNEADLERRLHAAANAIGATAEIISPRVFDAEIDRPSGKILSTWQRSSPGGLERLSEELAKKIRTYRPEVVVSSTFAEGRSRTGSQKLISRLVADACDYAASEHAFSEHLTVDRLSLWNPLRVLTCVPNVGKNSVAKSKRLSGHGYSALELAKRANGLLGQGTQSSNWSLQSLRKADDDLKVGQNALAGLNVKFDSVARRARTKSDTGERDYQKRLAASRLALHGGASRVENIERFIGGDRNLAARLLFENAQEEPDPIVRVQLMHELIDRHPNSELADSALSRLFRFHSSVEQQWRHRAKPVAAQIVSLERATEGIVNVETTTNQSSRQVQTVSATGETFAVDWQPAQQILNRIRSTRPAMYAEPSVLFGMHSMQSGLSPDGRPQMLKKLQGSVGKWKYFSMQESLVNGAKEESTKRIWKCKSHDQRPELNGVLDDAIWQDAKSYELSINANDQPAVFAFAHDTEFLYFAAVCPKRPGVAYHPQRNKRPRDSDISKMDRLEIKLDINRDYTSWWSLAFDHRGWTNDALNDDRTWDPKYYVASRADDTTWSIEVAVPLEELAPNEYRNSRFWAVDVKRVVPGSHVERWVEDWGNGQENEKNTENPPDLQGVMHLE